MSQAELQASFLLPAFLLHHGIPLDGCTNSDEHLSLCLSLAPWAKEGIPQHSGACGQTFDLYLVFLLSSGGHTVNRGTVSFCSPSYCCNSRKAPQHSRDSSIIMETRIGLGPVICRVCLLDSRSRFSDVKREPSVKQRRNGACNGICAEAGLVRCLPLPCTY